MVDEIEEMIEALHNDPIDPLLRKKVVEWLRELKIERAKVSRQDGIIQALGDNLNDERRAHEVEIARLNEDLSDARHDVLMMTMDMEGAD